MKSFGCLTVFDLNERTGEATAIRYGSASERLAIGVGWSPGGMGPLLNAELLMIGTDERIEDGQNMAPIIHHARENVAQIGVALCLAMPFGQDRCRNFDVPSQLIRGVAAQEQAVKKRSLTLREVEIVDDLGRSELWHGAHRKNAVYPKPRPRQVGLRFLCRVPGNPYSWGCSRHGMVASPF